MKGSPHGVHVADGPGAVRRVRRGRIRGRRRARLRRHPGADRRRPGGRPDPPRRRARCSPSWPTSSARSRWSPAARRGRRSRSASLDEVGNALGDSGRELYVLGQYGNERWSSTSRRIVSPRPPRGLASYLGALPALLRRLDAADAFIEEKGLAVAVHTRRLPDPAGAFDRLLPELEKLATDTGLVVEPGRQVIEVRAPGMDKGHVVRTLVARALAPTPSSSPATTSATSRPSRRSPTLREEGLPTFLVCSGSEEQHALAAHADLVVDGPDGVLDFLRQLTSDGNRDSPRRNSRPSRASMWTGFTTARRAP